MDAKHQELQTPRVLRLREVEQRTGLRRASIYRRGNEGTFPKPIRLGGNSSGWIESEIATWINDRVAERDAQAGAK